MLTIHRAARADALVDALAAVIAPPLDDPFTPEVVSVPTRGIERRLTQRLSSTLGASTGRQDGVCANIDFPFPGRLVGAALSAATDVDPDLDPWLPERSVWPLIAAVDENLDEPWMAALAAHLGATGGDGDETRRARRFGAVRHLADLFDRYAVQRPAMIRAWAAGDDTDGHGEKLPPDVAWQAQLWRALRERVATPSPAERLADACARVRDEPDVVDLPARISLFGLTRLPTSHLGVLDAIAASRDVHLFLLHPSPALWDRVAPRIAHDSGHGAVPRRDDDTTAALPRNPLLATWGRDARELQLVVAAAADGTPHTDVLHPVEDPDGTLLQRIQADVRADRPPSGLPLPGAPDERLVLDPADRSLQVHACHGRARQVEVLRDTILHLLADDPTLEPRDVIVMCPDIETYAPLIEATFGRAEGGSTDYGPDLRVRLADRSLRQTNPLLAVVAELLTLVDARITASQVVDFASHEPVRRRFRLDDDDLARVEEWVAATGIRWGLDPAHRAPYHLDALGANTWRAGLDRVLLGVTMSEDDLRLVGGVLPLDDVDSGDIDLAGRLAELVDRLDAAITALARPQPIDAWAAAIATATDALAATTPDGEWQRIELARILEDIATDAAGSPVALELLEVRALLADRLRGRPTRASFRTGHLTMCTLVPMRSVPHRVVCVLGLDDGVFPRRTAPDGDDIIERARCVGDRDPRSEDRQLLLDALLAATDHLVLTYSGRDERTNQALPPAVPLGELLDVVDRTARGPGGAPARGQVVVEHPLQPFDARNFVTGALVPDRPWSFDPVALGGAQALADNHDAETAFLPRPLAPVDAAVVELDDLVRFIQHPVKAFLRQRLGVTLSDAEEEPSDGLPVELDGLAQWNVGQRLLDARLAGVGADAAADAERVRGILPPGEFGTDVLLGLLPVVDEIVAVTVGEAGGEATTVDVNVDLGAGRSLVGTVPGVVGDVVRTATYSRVAPRHRLAAWMRLLALTVSHPDRSFTAVTVGRGPDGGAGVARIGPLDPDAAREQLDALVDLRTRGLREPLPLYEKTSAAYAAARPARREFDARGEWETDRWDLEDREPEHQLVLGGVVPFDALLVESPEPGENGPGWVTDETSRFGRYAHRLWEGLLAVEELENL